MDAGGAERSRALILVEELLGEPTVLFENERVVGLASTRRISRTR